MKENITGVNTPTNGNKIRPGSIDTMLNFLMANGETRSKNGDL